MTNTTAADTAATRTGALVLTLLGNVFVVGVVAVAALGTIAAAVVVFGDELLGIA